MNSEPEKGVSFSSYQNTRDFKTGDTWILAVGINAYPDAPLYNCVRDTQGFLSVMQEDYGIQENQVITLFDDQATKDGIFEALDNLYGRMQPEDNFIFWFSGHGFKHPVTKMGYWVPAGSRLNSTAGGIPNAEILAYVKAMPARHILLLIDSCFSGTLFAPSQRGESLEPHLLEGHLSRWALTAGREETVSDGQIGDNSPFVEKLLYRLRTQPEANPLFITELAQFVINAVGRNAKQQPDGRPLQNVDDMGGCFALRKKQKLKPDLAAFEAAKNNVEALAEFIEQYPLSPLRLQAEKILVRETRVLQNNEKIRKLFDANAAQKNQVLIKHLRG